MPFFGEIAALGTAFLWAGSAVCFNSLSRLVGVRSANRYRLLVAAFFLVIIHWLVLRQWIPSPTHKQLMALVTSGIIGLVIGDSFLFQSYVDLGPRLALLIFNLNPFFTAILGWPFLGEKMPPLAWLGMTITIGGALWVLMEENANKNGDAPKHLLRGSIFAILAAMGQASAYVISKPALIGDDALSPLSATLIRVASATLLIWIFGIARGRHKKVVQDIKNKKAMLYLVTGALVGPSIGIWLSLIALKLIPAGISATLMATLPVMILPVVILVYKEKVSWRAFLGALLTVIGVAILFLIKS